MCAFYLPEPSKELRFGDVVTGFQYAAIHMDSPNKGAKRLDVKIHVTSPECFAIMTPCCSIEEKSVALAPFVDLRWQISQVPYLKDNPLRINSEMEAHLPFSPEQLEKMPEAKRNELYARPPAYIYLDCFVYAPTDIFATYTVKRGGQEWKDIRHRMVDFKSIFRVECTQIVRNQPVSDGIKIAELSEESRTQLRQKLTYYFGRPA